MIRSNFLFFRLLSPANSINSDRPSSGFCSYCSSQSIALHNLFGPSTLGEKVDCHSFHEVITGSSDASIRTMYLKGTATAEELIEAYFSGAQKYDVDFSLFEATQPVYSRISPSNKSDGTIVLLDPSERGIIIPHLQSVSKGKFGIVETVERMVLFDN
jgi:hypothetical protein